MSKQEQDPGPSDWAIVVTIVAVLAFIAFVVGMVWG